MAIVGLRLNDVAERLKDRRITLEVSDSAKEWLASEGWSDEYGARAVARVVRTELTYPLAKKLLAGTIRSVEVRVHPPFTDLQCFAETVMLSISIINQARTHSLYEIITQSRLLVIITLRSPHRSN